MPIFYAPLSNEFWPLAENACQELAAGAAGGRCRGAQTKPVVDFQHELGYAQ
jgi:hypothetical protein